MPSDHEQDPRLSPGKRALSTPRNGSPVRQVDDDAARYLTDFLRVKPPRTLPGIPLHAPPGPYARLDDKASTEAGEPPTPGYESETVPSRVYTQLTAGIWDSATAEIIEEGGGGVGELRERAKMLLDFENGLREQISIYVDDIVTAEDVIADPSGDSCSREMGEEHLAAARKALGASRSELAWTRYVRAVNEEVMRVYLLCMRAEYWSAVGTAYLDHVASLGLGGNASTDSHAEIIVDLYDKLVRSGTPPRAYSALIKAYDELGTEPVNGESALKSVQRRLKDHWGFQMSSPTELVELLRPFAKYARAKRAADANADGRSEQEE